jgi:two-component SAPR family response regulator
MDAIADAYRLMGELTNADSWAGRARVEAEKTGGAMELGVCLMTAGLVKRAQEEHKEAVELLEKAIPYLKEKGAQRELITAYFHLASVYFSIKRKTLALKALEEAAKLVQDLGYDHFLLIEAARNPALVQYASANKVADGYYTRVMKAAKAAGKPAEEGDGEESAADANAVMAFGFGHARVELGGREVTDLEWRSEKSKEMFFLFLANRRPLRKEDIVTALWPDLPEDKTTSAFHSNMYRLRKALYQEVIAKDSGRYVLDPQRRFVFDVEEFQAELQKADAAKGTAEGLAHLERAQALYKGQFAPDFYSEWAETMRWQFEEQNMSLLGLLAAAYNEAGEYKKSADVCQRIIELDEFNEAAWYRLMANYVQSGQTEAARYCYDRYVRALAKDDMDDDAPEFDELVKEMASGKLRV